MKTLPILDAPTPSISLSLVKDNNIAKVVDITISQKKPDVRLKRASSGAAFLIAGAIVSAPKCAIPVIPSLLVSVLHQASFG